jgi:hypothetical protein
MQNVIVAFWTSLAMAVVQAQDPRMVPVDGYQMRVWMAGLDHADRYAHRRG